MKALGIVTLVSLCLTTLGLAAPPQTTESAVVLSALQLIQTNHTDSPDPIKLLVAALNGLRRALSRAGATKRLADLDSRSEASARASFVARFNQAMGLASGRLSAAQLARAAVISMVSSLRDPFSTFVTPEQLAESRRREFGGIGIQFRRVEDGIFIWRVFSRGPAAKAGLREFDRIVAVDGQSVRGLTGDQVRSRIRGREGSTVRFTIHRPGQTAPLTFSVTRGLITPVLVTHRMLQGGIGYIHTLFTDGASREMNTALEDLSRQGMRALVLDLRLSSGGTYRELDEISRLLLPPGLLVYSVTGQQSLTYRTAGAPLLSPSVRMVVLVGGDTEALSELLASALSERGRGRLVGTRTAGLGGFYRSFDLPGGGALTIKTGRAFTGKGVPLKNGVRPDVEVRLRARDLDRGHDPQLERAIRVASQL